MDSSGKTISIGFSGHIVLRCAQSAHLKIVYSTMWMPIRINLVVFGCLRCNTLCNAPSLELVFGGAFEVC